MRLKRQSIKRIINYYLANGKALTVFILLLSSVNVFASNLSESLLAKIESKQWLHGSANCSESQQPAIDQLKLNQTTYIFRQNKCSHFEAPFIYLLLGSERALLVDTGAISDSTQFPLYQTVTKIIDHYAAQKSLDRYPLVVVHSHSHDDHYLGDSQFADKQQVTLVKPDSQSVAAFFKWSNWPTGSTQLELGNRSLSILAIPGHQVDSIAIFDSRTNLMLTGDSFYPGRLYIRDWSAFKQSIERLLEFSQIHNVKAFLGAHIEMAKDGKDYPVGATYQPDEVDLVLTLEELKQLNQQLKQLGDQPSRVRVRDSIIYPVE